MRSESCHTQNAKRAVSICKMFRVSFANMFLICKNEVFHFNSFRASLVYRMKCLLKSVDNVHLFHRSFVFPTLPLSYRI
jgi:hypothetical protein